MTETSSSKTNVALLSRLRQVPPDQAAWREFSERYGKVIYTWCLNWNLQDADAADVTQMVLVKLFQVLRTFQYDPARSFHAWLKTVSYHVWVDFVNDRRRRRQFGEGEGDALLDSVPARDDLAERLAGALDRELFEVASARVRLRVEPHTWEAFRLTAVQQADVPDVAARLGMKLTSVYKAKSNMIKMLQEEIRWLEREAVS